MVIRTGGRRNPQTNYKQSTYRIAYLDILGGKSLICQDSDNIFLNHLNMFVQDLHDIFDKLANFPNMRIERKDYTY